MGWWQHLTQLLGMGIVVLGCEWINPAQFPVTEGVVALLFRCVGEESKMSSNSCGTYPSDGTYCAGHC